MISQAISYSCHHWKKVFLTPSCAETYLVIFQIGLTIPELWTSKCGQYPRLECAMFKMYINPSLMASRIFMPLE